MPRMWIIIAVLAIVLVFGAPIVVEKITTGSVVGPKYPENAEGVVNVAPMMILQAVNAELRKQGKPEISLDVLALARCLNSEHGREPRAVREWVAWAVVNDAKKGRVSVFAKLTNSSNPATRGLFARQRTDSRYAATNLGARMDDIELARAVLLSAKQDPTRGATNFFSPETQDKLFALAQAGDPRYVGRITRSAADTRKLWQSRGLSSRGAPPGVSVNKVEFFGA